MRNRFTSLTFVIGWLSLLTSLSVTPDVGATAPFDTAEVDRSAQPNIVFIMADDLGWQDVGFAGAQYYETPHIDQLAAAGMRFSAAYSGGPNCSPTRACLMTGTYSPRHQIYTPGGRSKGKVEYMRLLVPAVGRDNPALSREAAEQFTIRNDLPSDFVCIPELLGDVGYTTARIGKWHLGPDTQGFDLSTANGLGGPEGTHYGNVDVAEQLTDRAIAFIEENQSQPFFLYLSHWDVHSPFRARAEVVEKYRQKRRALPENERAKLDPVYAAMIEAVDTSVGRVVAKIDELNLSEQTIIVFTSDNGGLPRVSDLAPLRGQKGSLFEAGVRVATCVRWTGQIAADSACHTPITSVDWMPTFTNLATAELPTHQPSDGVDLGPLFRGEPIEERNIYWHYPLYLQGRGLTIDLPEGGTYSWRGFPSSSLRRGDYKLIEFHETGEVHLYHLIDDPGEQINLAAEMPELTRQLHQQLDQWQATTEAPIPGTPNPECILPPLGR